MESYLTNPWVILTLVLVVTNLISLFFVRKFHKHYALPHKINKWQDKTFPEDTPAGLLNHIEEELDELRKSPADPKEIPDIGILLIGYSHLLGWNLNDLIYDKFHKELIFRKWKKADDDGIYRHEKS